jgi:hypothetical protein
LALLALPVLLVVPLPAWMTLWVARLFRNLRKRDHPSTDRQVDPDAGVPL